MPIYRTKPLGDVSDIKLAPIEVPKYEYPCTDCQQTGMMNTGPDQAPVWVPCTRCCGRGWMPAPVNNTNL